MAGKRRNWKLKDGRYYARVAVPKRLQGLLGKTELIEALGADLGVATKDHPAAVARLRATISDAERSSEPPTAVSLPVVSAAPTGTRRPLVTADLERAAWEHYTETLARDDVKRTEMPTQAQIEAEEERYYRRFQSGELDPRDIFATDLAIGEYEFVANARDHYAERRNNRLRQLKDDLVSNDTQFMKSIVEGYIKKYGLSTDFGSHDWHNLAAVLRRAEIDALENAFERDKGFFGNPPKDPIIAPPPDRTDASEPLRLRSLFDNYISSRQAVGRHEDGGAAWAVAIEDLIKFLGHDDARRITRRNLIDWRDGLMSSGRSAKTVSAKYLAAISAVLRWAHDNDRLSSNEADGVRQEVPKKIRLREKGYTTAEAIKILKASRSHVPATYSSGKVRESPHITAAKRWVPLLCAFTGARVTEMTQLRKEDVRQEGERWILRITPEAGSVKTGQYRDVPLHHQIVNLGFMDFVRAAKTGPLFHDGQRPEGYLKAARTTSGRISQWLNDLKLVPDGVDPSLGWRHRFKTQGRELGGSDRVLDALQGHPGKTASDGYGDVTIKAKLKIIDDLPDYDLTD